MQSADVDAHEDAVARDEGLADRRLVEGVAEALLGFAQLARCLALGGDVAADSEVARQLAAGRADRGDRERDGQLVPVLVHERPLAGVGVLAARAVPEHASDRHAELLGALLELLRVMEEHGVEAPDDLLRAVADHALGAAVEDRDQPVRVGADDRVLRRCVEHGLERLTRGDGRRLARPQRLLGLALPRDVARHGLQLDDGAVPVPHGAPARLEPDGLAVLADEARGRRRPARRRAWTGSRR